MHKFEVRGRSEKLIREANIARGFQIVSSEIEKINEEQGGDKKCEARVRQLSGRKRSLREIKFLTKPR